MVEEVALWMDLIPGLDPTRFQLFPGPRHGSILIHSVLRNLRPSRFPFFICVVDRHARVGVGGYVLRASIVFET